ncbi:MAG TPA: thioredoxin domain-containing protein [Acidobacteriaceae bacterium]|nr:thioredoxin domain-containing protein [Acidobacteriaceae bacterium]
MLAKVLRVRLSALRRLALAALIVFAPVGILSASAQTAVGGQVDHFTDTSMLKPPAGDKIALIEWEDLECPACAHAFPFVHQALNHYHIPYVRYDFLIPNHVWSHQAAIYARYMQDKISPDFAEDYRRQVFANQYRIASQDDLLNFTKQYMSSHGKQMPFVVDPTGQFEREVQADTNLGKKLGLQYTPTIVVATQHKWIEVKDVSDLYSAIDQALASIGQQSGTTPSAAHHTTAAHHTSTATH